MRGYLLLLTLKARVASKKQLVIPRLEQQAPVIDTRIKEKILKTRRNTVKQVYMWSEYITVLAWLFSENKLPIFVADRVSMIHDTTTINTWRHVEGEKNPADLGTREFAIPQLLENCWLRGPTWIKNEEEWPKRVNIKKMK